MAGLDRVRPEAKVEDAIRTHLSTRNGILEVVVLVGVGIGMTPVYRVSNLCVAPERRFTICLGTPGDAARRLMLRCQMG